MKINTNISALRANFNLNSVQSQLTASTNKLSSGNRITKAADDAAGMAISQKMHAQIRGLQRASKNGSDGVSFIQTTEGVLSEIENMLQNNEKSAEVLKAEKIVEQAKARLAEAKRKASQQKRKEENQHKYMMGGIVHKYFPECYQFDEQELNRIIASGMKSEQCQRIIEIVKKESADKRENAVVKAESEVAGDEGTGKSENA